MCFFEIEQDFHFKIICLQLMSLESIRSRFEFMSTITDFANFSRVGISYYDSSIHQLHVLEVWEDGSRVSLD